MNNEYVGLAGVTAGKRLQGPSVDTVEEALDALKSNRVASNDGDHGSVTVWIDDAGAYRGGFTRHCMPIDIVETRSEADLKAWLDQWMPLCDQRLDA